jgi:FdhD protein
MRGKQLTSNIVRVDLDPSVRVDALRLDRHFYASSSCGVCGKSSLEALAVNAQPFSHTHSNINADLICRMPNILRSAQPLFHQTGALHAAGLFDATGELLALREDVGRHNAVDKLIGQHLLRRQRFTPDHVMCISGRASFEILQKAIVARISTIIAVGAPSSLAVDLAVRFNVRLIGFADAKRFNVYAGSLV